MNKKHHRIAADVKADILRRVKEEGVSVAQAAKDHGISEGTIYGWMVKGATGASRSAWKKSCRSIPLTAPGDLLRHWDSAASGCRGSCVCLASSPTAGEAENGENPRFPGPISTSCSRSCPHMQTTSGQRTSPSSCSTERRSMWRL